MESWTQFLILHSVWKEILVGERTPGLWSFMLTNSVTSARLRLDPWAMKVSKNGEGLRSQSLPSSITWLIPASLHPHTPASLKPCTPAPLYPCISAPGHPTPASLHLCTPVPLYPCIPAPRHPYTPVSLYPCTFLSLHLCTPAFLHPCTPAPLQPYSSASMFYCCHNDRAAQLWYLPTSETWQADVPFGGSKRGTLLASSYCDGCCVPWLVTASLQFLPLWPHVCLPITICL
jgi:hypothetical protein